MKRFVPDEYQSDLTKLVADANLGSLVRRMPDMALTHSRDYTRWCVGPSSAFEAGPRFTGATPEEALRAALGVSHSESPSPEIVSMNAGEAVRIQIGLTIPPEWYVPKE